MLEELIDGSMAEIVSELEKEEGTGQPLDLLRRLSLWVRAGRRVPALATIERLGESKEDIRVSVLKAAGDFLIGREEWDLARRYLELFPEAVPGRGHVLIKEWAKVADPAVVDAWLAARAEAVPRYWFSQRLHFRIAEGTADALIAGLESDVKGHPGDLEKARRYLGAIRQVGRNHDPAWMADVCRPQTAYDSYRLGLKIGSLSFPAAISFYLRSLDTL